MPSYCHVVIMGHLTRDIEIRYAQNGMAVATVGLAVNRRFKQGDELKEEVGFFDVVMFGKTGETAAQYLRKGACAQFDGRLQQRRWQTDSGEKRSKVEIVAQQVTFLDKRPADSTSGAMGDAPDATAHEDQFSDYDKVG